MVCQGDTIAIANGIADKPIEILTAERARMKTRNKSPLKLRKKENVVVRIASNYYKGVIGLEFL